MYRFLTPVETLDFYGKLFGLPRNVRRSRIDDLLDIYYRALYDGRLSGPVNAVGPEPVRNSEYTRALAATMHRPALLPVPSIGPRLLLGKQGAIELAEASQRVQPSKLTALGHRFRSSTVADALAHQLGHDPAPGVL